MLNATKKELVKDFQSAPRIRPERAVQEGLRGRIRHLRRRAVRRADRRLRVHAPARGHVLHRADVARGRGRARAVHLGRVARSCSAWRRFADLGKPRDLAKVFDTVEYAKWKSFRESEDSRYVGLTLPRFLRPPAVQPGRRHHRRRLQLRRGRRRHRPPASTCGATPPTPSRTRLTDAFERLRLVRGDPRRRGRRPGRGPADPHLQDRRGRSRAEVPDRDRHHRPPREGTVATSASSRWSTARTPTTRRSSARSRRRRRASTTPTPPTPTPCCRRSCSTSSPCRASPTT